jgi:hypothetical protein
MNWLKKLFGVKTNKTEKRFEEVKKPIQKIQPHYYKSTEDLSRANSYRNDDNDLLNPLNVISPLNPINPLSPFYMHNTDMDISGSSNDNDLNRNDWSSSDSSSSYESNSSSWSSSDSSSYDSGSSGSSSSYDSGSSSSFSD